MEKTKQNRLWEYSDIAKHELKMLDDAGQPYPRVVPESWKKYKIIVYQLSEKL